MELLAAIVGIALYLINVRSGVTGRTSLLVSLGTIVVFTLGQGREFGQRDGVSFLLLLPLGLSVTREIAGDRTQPLITQAALVSLAAVGCMLKPFYVLGLGGLFLLRFLKAPSWKQVVRFELPLLIGLGILYILAVFVFFPQWIAMTRTTVTVYSSLNAPLSDFKPILLAHGLAMLVSLGMIALAWSAGRDIRYAGVFLVFALGLELGAQQGDVRAPAGAEPAPARHAEGGVILGVAVAAVLDVVPTQDSDPSLLFLGSQRARHKDECPTNN